MWRGTVRMRRRDCEAMDEEGTVGKGTVGRQMQSGNWGNGCGEGTEEMDKRKKLGKLMQKRDNWGGDCGERAAEKGLWGKGCREGTVGKGMQRRDCGERAAERGLWGKECRHVERGL